MPNIRLRHAPAEYGSRERRLRLGSSADPGSDLMLFESLARPTWKFLPCKLDHWEFLPNQTWRTPRRGSQQYRAPPGS